MNKISLAALALLASAPLVPLQAADSSAPDWWTVYDGNASQETHYVDLASFHDSDIGFTVQTLTLFSNGRAERGVTRVNCASPDAMSAVQAFVCGPPSYRIANGRDVPGEQVARLASLDTTPVNRSVSG